jgi:hypothetical protein
METTERRRGETLEKELLSAVWDELRLVGYRRLSFNSVAERAGTSKTVLYRRWPNRLELVRAAIRAHRPTPPGTSPNTGSLRSDVIGLYEQMSYGMDEISDMVYGMVSDAISDASVGESFLKELNEINVKSMGTILQNARARGEIATASLSEQIMTLPIDLARHRMLMTGKLPTRDVLTQIVDDIFLPLVLKA